MQRLLLVFYAQLMLVLWGGGLFCIVGNYSAFGVSFGSILVGGGVFACGLGPRIVRLSRRHWIINKCGLVDMYYSHPELLPFSAVAHCVVQKSIVETRFLIRLHNPRQYAERLAERNEYRMRSDYLFWRSFKMLMYASRGDLMTVISLLRDPWSIGHAFTEMREKFDCDIVITMTGTRSTLHTVAIALGCSIGRSENT
jgi:hypothetical protein